MSLRLEIFGPLAETADGIVNKFGPFLPPNG